MNDSKRLHPVAAVISFLGSLREIALPLILFYFINGRGETNFFGTLYYIAALIIFIGMLIFGILSWFRFTYKVCDGELRIEQGIIVRKKRYIPIEKIQTIDASSGIIQRLFGLVKIQIETAGGGDKAEAILSAITLEEAKNLREALSHKNSNDEADKGNRLDEQFTLVWRDLIIMASTSGGIGVILSAALAFLIQFDELLPTDYVYSVAENIIESGVALIAIGIVFVIFFSWLFSIVSTSVKFGNFKLVIKGENLLITRGLLEKRELTIPIYRIQAVRVQENLFRQCLGYATVYIEVAGGAQEKGENYSTILLPLIQKKKIMHQLSLFTREFVMEEEVQTLPKRAKKRYIFRLVIPLSLLVILVSVLLNPWLYFSFLLLPLAILFGTLMYKEAGWAISGSRLMLRYRFLNRHTVYTRKSRIQAVHYTHSFFQRKENLASVTVSTQSKSTGKHFKVVDVDGNDVLQIFKWYSYENKQPNS